MDRRQVLQVGAALTTLPLVGCAASPPPAPPPPASPPPAPAATEAPVASPPQPETSPDPPAAPAQQEGPKVSFSRVIARLGKNHGHEITVPLADVMAGAEKTYDITGTAKHAHSVTLTADHMKSLQAGKILRTESTTGLHKHRVVVRCAPAVDPPEWVSVVKFSSSGKDEHEIVITAADMGAKAEKTYDVQGLAGHTHQVTVTAADFEKLLQGGPVTHQTTRDPDDAHLHTVTIEYRKPRA